MVWMRSNCGRLAIGPWVVLSASGSPTTISEAAAAARTSTFAICERDTSMRVGALQDWPRLRKAAPTPSGTARLSSASGRMIFGDLPPSSWATRLTVGAAACATRTPARVEPVIEIMSTCGCDARPVAHDGTRPVDEVEYAGRTTGIVHHLGEQQGAQGRQFAGLQHHRAARRERRTDLGCDLVERPVPGRDEAADADRLAHDGGAAARA